MKKCPICNFENSDDALYCIKCGTPLPTQQPYMKPSRRPRKWLVVPFIAGIIITVFIIASMTVLVPATLGIYAKELVSPSQVSAILGGTWKVVGLGRTAMIISEPIVMNLSSNHTNSLVIGVGSNQQTPMAQGLTESLRGIIDERTYNMTLTLWYFSNSSEALNYFSLQGFFNDQRALHYLNASLIVLSNNEFVMYRYSDFLHSYISEIILLNGSLIKEVQIFGPTTIPQNHLEDLINIL
ncbi:hypothetical protein J5U23_02248 [Saccharolobus shibatae B12]|uniref:Zinc-ribbon domain-containing protein n=1 Tax=Saccharolobus shibatae (strain ATCC 51178 / DSM 5389 / JCM 8931 / NBRC 15437 / B12) TaxID=523848 RepID=A0A8F5BQB3_SACSH|nr:zinc-ribbon domain-containing protein [Saccharolobus shibatae]QXJ29379.1 hypothetical protein J5U23_02248 [Saccharolobus shibatae B12]